MELAFLHTTAYLTEGETMEDKQALLRQISPLAVLKSITTETQNAIHDHCLGNGYIGIWKFPFRVGRESRINTVDGKDVLTERQKNSITSPNNDIYLIDNGTYLQISRQHFQIEQTELGYVLRDRGSACGTTINEEQIGGEDTGGTTVLQDGDIIRVGSKHSPYQFQFIVLQ